MEGGKKKVKITHLNNYNEKSKFINTSHNINESPSQKGQIRSTGRIFSAAKDD